MTMTKLIDKIYNLSGSSQAPIEVLIMINTGRESILDANGANCHIKVRDGNLIPEVGEDNKYDYIFAEWNCDDDYISKFITPLIKGKKHIEYFVLEEWENIDE